MDYEQAIEYIHETLKFGWKLGLTNIGHLLRLMGDPHKKLRFVHVAGTNGKGSTTAFISSILTAAGYRTGMYTSPYIQRFTERIRVDGTEIEREDVARLAAFVREKAELMVAEGGNHPTEFEIVTAMAFQYYHECRCGVVALEVGLGGRFDSTNIIDVPELAVITTINYDHTERLGKTLAEIAFEKAGIIKPGGTVLLYPQSREAEEVFERVCAERGANLHKADFSTLAVTGFDLDGQSFRYEDGSDYRIALLGSHQACNAALAIQACRLLFEKGFLTGESAIREGLASARWPGRFEVMRTKPVFLLDGAHNPEGAKVLAESLSTYFQGRKIDFILGVFRDKDYRSIVEALLPSARSFTTVTPGSDRALPAHELAGYIRSYCHDVIIGDTIEAVVKAGLNVPEDRIVCACGSLHFIGEVRNFLEQQ